MPEYLTTRELAELLRIKERKVYDLAATQQVPCTRATGKLLFPRAAIDAWLAEHGEGPQSAVHRERPAMLLGSHDPLLDWAVRESRCGLGTMLDSSLDGLQRFAAGDGIATGLHLYDADEDDWNIPAVAARFSAYPVVLTSWARRSRGVITTPALQAVFQRHGLAAAREHRLVPRQAEAGSQVLLLEQLRRLGIDSSEIQWAETARSEHDATLAIQHGKAEAAFGLAADAAAFNLAFIPVVDEHYDLLVDRRAYFLPPWQALMAFCRTPAFAARAAEFGGYEVSGFGQVRFLGG